ncbi:helix-turn-helix transcriptional regulator [Pseudomonas syringae pv. syringae]|uniref:helix-turn-helix transcriptional regulator n=1 Tax=Pseudomonas syringae TaxID=317 RepID=UPI0023F9B8D2|nr:helix-turn-helix transcriptional regulator [Pseudomonas syringae]MDF5892726.1 helix-turn-helix transcriptional regulator [Pseudomonas syringae pv. syringae]
MNLNRIAEFREAAGIKQRDLVAALGWTQTRVSNYEAGRRTAGLAECRAITAALNKLGAACSLDDVFPPALPIPEAA